MAGVAAMQRVSVAWVADALSNDFATYLDSTVWLKATATEQLGDQYYILCSTLRALGDKLRLEAWLGTNDGAAVWKNTFDGDLGDSFDWQDRTGEQVTAAIFGIILNREKQRLAPQETVSSIRSRNGYYDNEYTARYLDGLAKAGLPE